jgi:hypothetical protein
MNFAYLVYFFDSHGALWATCEATHPDAVAFGPTGVARECNPSEIGLRGECGTLSGSGTAFARASKLALTTELEDGWHYLTRPNGRPFEVKKPGGSVYVGTGK